VIRPARAGLVPLLALLLATGCSRCGAPLGGPPAERWVPAGVAGVLLVPDVGAASRQAAALHGALAAMPGGEDLHQLRTLLGAQLSFDPFDPASLEGAGIDVRRGAAVAELAPGADPAAARPLLVVPVGDPAKLDALFTRLAKERLGATVKGQENANGRALDVWRRAAGEPALLSVAVVEGTALVSAGPQGPDVLRTVLALDPALSLEQSASWKRARAAAGDGLAAQFFVPPGSPALAGLPLTDGLVAGVSAGARELRLVAAALLGPQESRLRPLAGTGPGKAGPTALDPDTVLAVRISAAPAAALRLLREVSPGALPDPALDKAAEALEPGVDLGVGLAARPELAAAVASGGQLDPLRVARFELVATAKEPAALRPLFDELARAGGGGAHDGRWRVPAGQGEVAWTLAGRTLALSAGPKGGLDALAARAAGQGKGFAAPTPTAAQALAGGLGGAVLDGRNLVKALKALPPEAYGSGPDAVVTRALVEKLAEPAGRAGTLSLQADLPAGALRAAFVVELAEPPRAP
jgi:hypothetical protein